MKKNIPIFVTHYGCPNQCIFCNQKKISGVSRGMDLQACEALLQESSQKQYPPETTEIAFFGGSFTGIPVEEQKSYLELAKKYRNFFHGVRLSTRPDYINVGVLEMLSAYGVTTIELGVQSMVDAVLLKNRRGMTARDTIRAVERIRKFPISIGLQMMISMYGSTRENDLETADRIIALKPDFVRIYPTVVLEDTPLYSLYQTGEYQVKSLEETITLTAAIYRKFLDAGIPVIRVGLMSSEEINSKNVIGAYHEAFGELVQNEIYFQLISEQLHQIETRGKKLFIYCDKRSVSKVAGHKRNNLIRLQEQYHFRKIKLIPEATEKPFWVSVTVES